MNLDKLSDLLGKVHPENIRRLYPDKKLFEKYEAARALVGGLLQRAEGREHSLDLIGDIEKATQLLSELHLYVSGNTEIGAKARLNSAVIWAQAGYHERAVFLAGIAKEKKIRQPYRTQLATLPANACLARYRQLYRIEKWIRDSIETAPDPEIGILLGDMQRAYLQQMNFFATEAHLENPSHPYAAYMRMLAALLIGRTFEIEGNMRASEQLNSAAESIATDLIAPTPESHYMELQYHIMNHGEFATFKKLSKKHRRISERLEDLSGKAQDILKNGGGRRPPMYFNVATYVAVGARAASIAGVILLAGAAFDLDVASVKHALERLWHIAVAQGPQFQGLGELAHFMSNVPSHSAVAHTGGLASPLGHTGGLAGPLAHTGGVARQLIGAGISGGPSVSGSLSNALASLSLPTGGLASLRLA